MKVSIEQIAGCLTNQHLGLILMPTEQCNFRCTYCYEDFSIGKMTSDVILGVKNLIEQRIAELKSLSIEWFGGEPLVAKNVIYDIGQHIKNLLALQYQSGMTTNGFNLKGETVTKLLDLDIKGFQISLDGPREWHNKTRLRLSGQGSFDEIWNNLLALKKVERDFSVTLRVHVTPENLDYLPDLITQINQEFGSDARFKVFFKAIENLGGANSGSFKTLKGAEKSEIVAGLYKLLANSEKISSMGKQQQPYICYAAKPNNLVVRANGTIAKCTVVFNDDRNQLGKINPDGTLTISAEKLNLWVRGMKTMEKDTLHCPLHGLPKLEAKSRVIPIMAVNQ